MRGQWLTTALAALGAVIGLAGIAAFWITGESQPIVWPWSIPGGEFSIAVDGLSAIFLVPIFLVCIPFVWFTARVYPRPVIPRLPWADVAIIHPKAGDILVEFGGQPIQNLYDFTYALGNKKAGDVVSDVVQRNGNPLKVSVTLEERK